jgi:hypothetical protein
VGEVLDKEHLIRKFEVLDADQVGMIATQIVSRFLSGIRYPHMGAGLVEWVRVLAERSGVAFNQVDQT